MSELEGFIVVSYIALAVGTYVLFTRIFLRIVDPKGEYGLDHDIPLPGPVRWTIVLIALVMPLLIITVLYTLAGWVL